MCANFVNGTPIKYSFFKGKYLDNHTLSHKSLVIRFTPGIDPKSFQ